MVDAWWCMDDAWMMYEWCMDDAWMMYGWSINWKGFLSEAFPYWYSMFQFCGTRMARELVYRWVYRYTRGRHVVDTLLILFWHVTPSTVCFVPMPLGKRRCRVRQRRLSRTRNSMTWTWRQGPLRGGPFRYPWREGELQKSTKSNEEAPFPYPILQSAIDGYLLHLERPLKRCRGDYPEREIVENCWRGPFAPGTAPLTLSCRRSECAGY